MRLMAVAVLVGVVLSGCGAADEASRSESVEPPTPSPSPPPSVSARWKEQSWGPLAVVPPAEGGLEAGPYKGTLRITDECVFLEGQRDEVLLWHAGRTQWNDQNRTITIDNPGPGSVITVADGDRVSMSGGGDGYDSFQELVKDVDASIGWVSQPSAACESEEFWVVSSLWKGSPPTPISR